MNESYPQNNDSQQNNIKSEFKKSEFIKLIETLWGVEENPDIREKMKKEIYEDLVKKKMKASHISHL